MNPLAIRQLLVLALLALVTACGPNQQATVQDSSGTRGRREAEIKVPEPPNYESRVSKVKDLGRRERCIALLNQALDLKKKHDRTSDKAEKKRLKKKALAIYEKAGGLYEQLQMDVDEVDPKLWGRAFSKLERTWQKKSRSLKRWRFH